MGTFFLKLYVFPRAVWPSTHFCHRDLSQEASFLVSRQVLTQIRQEEDALGMVSNMVEDWQSWGIWGGKAMDVFSMRRFWATVSHPVTADRLKWLHHITDQGDQLGHHRGSETSREVLATKGLLGGRGTWEGRKQWEQKTEKSWQVWLVGTRGQCLYRLFRAVATMVLEAMSQLLKEAELRQISQL